MNACSRDPNIHACTQLKLCRDTHVSRLPYAGTHTRTHTTSHNLTLWMLHACAGIDFAHRTVPGAVFAPARMCFDMFMNVL